MLLKFLHIAFIFSGIALVYGTELILHRISRSGDTRTIRTVFGMAKPIGTIAPVIFMVGVGFGLTAGVVNGYNLLAPWLLATYVLVAAVMVAGLTITVPWMNRVGALAAAAPDGPASSDLTGALHDGRVTALMWVSIVVDGHRCPHGLQARSLTVVELAPRRVAAVPSGNGCAQERLRSSSSQA